MHTRATGSYALVLLAALFVASLPSSGHAATMRAGEQPGIAVDERITEDVYIAGGTISAAGVAVADLVAAGGSVLISGGVGSDLIALGGSLTLLGNVGDDLRAIGGSVVVGGGVGGDAVLAGGQLTIGGSGIEGDLLAGGGMIRVDAPIEGEVRIGGGEVYLNSTISGNVEIYAEKLALGSSARIQGDLIYTARKEAVLEEGAVVAGEMTFRESERDISKGGAAAVLSFALLGAFLSHLVGALFFGLFFRRFSEELVAKVAAKPFMEVGRGLVVIIVLPVVSIMLFITFLGIPIGILGFLIFLVTLLFLWFTAPVVLGAVAHKAIFKGEDHRIDWKTILLGVFLYAILGIIPLIGWLVQLGLLLATLGAVVQIKWSAVKEWR